MLEEILNSPWQLVPDSILLHIFSYTEATTLLNAAQVCKSWNRVSHDEFLWKSLFYKDWKVLRTTPRALGKNSWRAEYKRLKHHTPMVESEVLTEHTNQVLHVSFSHNGEMFASSSKDGFIKVWNSDYPVSVRYSENMKEYGWKYTQFSQFNESDTLLLVSGVHAGLHSTTGEIFVFSVDGEFTLQSKVLNKPYDIFGTWYNDTYLLSGHLNWLGHMVSSSLLWLNYAYQETDDAYKAVVGKMYRFYNKNASSVRTIMVANCMANEEACCIPEQFESEDAATVSHMESVSNVRGNPLSHNVFVNLGNSQPGPAEIHRERQAGGMSVEENVVRPNHHDALLSGYDSPAAKFSLHGQPLPHRVRKDTDPYDGSLMLLEDSWKDEELFSDSDDEEAFSRPHITKNIKTFQEIKSAAHPKVPKPIEVPPPADDTDEGIILDPTEKFLIFTTGSKTYTPHQIGFKRMRPFKFQDKISASLVERLAEQRERIAARSSSPNYADEANVEHLFDKVDHLIDLHGHIIGMALSPDHRYLYVNNRPWPENYVIENPLRPPAIAQEIDIHVIDLVTMKEVGTMLRSHKAYTPNDECFFIFLDVCDEYVASGAEDKHGYLWDRHYGICLAKYPHLDVVNSVAFNPMDSEMLITASDDYTLKIWRSEWRTRQIEQKSGDSSSSHSVNPGIID